MLLVTVVVSFVWPVRYKTYGILRDLYHQPAEDSGDFHDYPSLNVESGFFLPPSKVDLTVQSTGGDFRWCNETGAAMRDAVVPYLTQADDISFGGCDVNSFALDGDCVTAHCDSKVVISPVSIFDDWDQFVKEDVYQTLLLDAMLTVTEVLSLVVVLWLLPRVESGSAIAEVELLKIDNLSEVSSGNENDVVDGPPAGSPIAEVELLTIDDLSEVSSGKENDVVDGSPTIKKESKETNE